MDYQWDFPLYLMLRLVQNKSICDWHWICQHGRGEFASVLFISVKNAALAIQVQRHTHDADANMQISPRAISIKRKCQPAALFILGPFRRPCCLDGSLKKALAHLPGMQSAPVVNNWVGAPDARTLIEESAAHLPPSVCVCPLLRFNPYAIGAPTAFIFHIKTTPGRPVLCVDK